MMLFRRAMEKDLNGIHDLALESGIVGITSLPKDKKVLKKRLLRSIQSFKKNILRAQVRRRSDFDPTDEYYFFVLEDLDISQVVGCSAIEACTGFDTPFYSYQLSQHTRICHASNIRSDYEVLSLVNDYQNKSELCTLFLKADYRKNHYGLLLSKARFLFMAQYPERFSTKIIAEMRGISDDKGRSPFWENLGKHFFKMTYMLADSLTLSTNKQFIADLMPRNPIYVNLLAIEAQEAIGKPHKSTIPAMHILMREGFCYQSYVDIFDAGPSIEAPLQKIHTLKNSQLFRLASLSDGVSSKPFLVANTELDFRATLAEVIFDEEKKTAILSKATAEMLALDHGDYLRVAPF